jgi:hypothetical protein
MITDRKPKIEAVMIEAKPKRDLIVLAGGRSVFYGVVYELIRYEYETICFCARDMKVLKKCVYVISYGLCAFEESRKKYRYLLFARAYSWRECELWGRTWT